MTRKQHEYSPPETGAGRAWNVRRFVGLNPDPTDHEHPDVKDLYPDAPLQEEMPTLIEQERPEPVPPMQAAPESVPVQQVPAQQEETPQETPTPTDTAAADTAEATATTTNAAAATTAATAGARRRLLEGEGTEGAEGAASGEGAATVEVDPDNELSEEALESFGSFEDYEAPRGGEDGDGGLPTDRYRGHYEDYRGYGSEEFWEGEVSEHHTQRRVSAFRGLFRARPYPPPQYTGVISEPAMNKSLSAAPSAAPQHTSVSSEPAIHTTQRRSLSRRSI
eukprot:1179196-Prorocentrum_minimum.AAC.1